jgi:hypothetical protein
MRYSINASFQEEQRTGFIVTHQMSKEYDTARELSNATMQFLTGYDSTCCHHLKFEVIEN